jgi:hypothetical protein
MADEDLDRELAILQKKAQLLKLQKEMNFAQETASEITPGEALTDLGNSAVSGVAQGALGLAQIPSLPFELFSKAGTDEMEPYMKSEIYGLLQRGKEALGYNPTTPLGRYTKSIAESAPAAAIGPGGPLLKSAMALGSGVGAEAGSAAGPIGRVAGSLLGGLVPAYAMGKSPNSAQLVHESLNSTTPGDFSRAGRMAKILGENKIKSYLSSQLLGPRSTLDDLVEEASAYSHTRPGLVTQTANAPKEAAEAVRAWVGKNLPPTVSSRREFLGDIQETATRRIAAADKLSNLRYAQQMPQPPGAVPGVTPQRVDYSPGDMMDMQKELLDLARSPKYVNSEGGKTIERFVKEVLTEGELPVTNRWGVNNIFKDLNKIKMKEGWAGLPDRDIKAIVGKYTDDFAAARAAKEAVQRKVVEPMKKGLVGDIAHMGGGMKPDRYTALESAFNRVFTADRNQAAEIMKFGDDIGPREFAQFFGEYLEKAVAKTMNRASGLDAPYKFTTEVARTPAQFANLNASLKVVAKAMGAKEQEVVKGFSNLMRGLDTYKDLVLAPRLNPGDIGAKAGVNVFGMVIAPHSRAGRVSWDIVTRRTYKEIVDMVKSPDGLKQLEQLARHKPTSARMRAFIESMLQASVQGMSEGSTSPLTEDIIKGAK